MPNPSLTVVSSDQYLSSKWKKYGIIVESPGGQNKYGKNYYETWHPDSWTHAKFPDGWSIEYHQLPDKRHAIYFDQKGYPRIQVFIKDSVYEQFSSTTFYSDKYATEEYNKRKGIDNKSKSQSKEPQS